MILLFIEMDVNLLYELGKDKMWGFVKHHISLPQQYD